MFDGWSEPGVYTGTRRVNDLRVGEEERSSEGAPKDGSAPFGSIVEAEVRVVVPKPFADETARLGGDIAVEWVRS